MQRLGLLLAGLACAGVVGCTETVLPVEDLCRDDDQTSWCAGCVTDEDCVIAGNPCCHTELRYYCVHADKAEKVPECEVTGCTAPTPPNHNRCACTDGHCHAH